MELIIVFFLYFLRHFLPLIIVAVQLPSLALTACGNRKEWERLVHSFILVFGGTIQSPKLLLHGRKHFLFACLFIFCHTFLVSFVIAA